VRLLSWNVQWCRGTDGRVDPSRIAAEVRRLADPDVACFQEVAQNYAELPGSRGEDQIEALAREFPGYDFAYGYGVDLPDGEGARKRFGNVIVSRLPLLRVLRHALPWPADPDVPSMPRVAVEAVVETPFGLIRVLTTHLEFYSAPQRAAQIERLRELHAEACAQALRPPLALKDSGPFRREARPRPAIVCGDFNLPPHDAARRRLLAPFDDGTPSIVDAWQALHPGTPHPHTFRLYERDPGVTPYCCDYVFVSEDLAPRVIAMRIDADSQASDHQPVIVEFRD